MKTLFSFLSFTSLLAICLHATTLQAAPNKSSPFEGSWIINHEETDKVQVKYKDGSGVQGDASRFKPKITVGMGLPMPQRFKQAPMSNLSPKDPEVLRCSTMTINHEDKKRKKTTLLYDGVNKETLVSGHYRGRDTKKGKKKITQKYKTPDRKVTKTWSIRDDGRLFVSVKLNPTKDKARVYNRVFDRVTSETDAAATSTSSDG